MSVLGCSCQVFRWQYFLQISRSSHGKVSPGEQRSWYLYIVFVVSLENQQSLERREMLSGLPRIRSNLMPSFVEHF